MLFALFAISVVVLELIMRQDGKKHPAVAAPEFTSSETVVAAGDTATMDLVRLAEALAAGGTTRLQEPEPSSSSDYGAYPREAADRSS
jgi:hypothetical protein